MVRIRRFSVVKTATVVALMYMVIVAVFAIPFFLLFAVTGVSVNGGPTQAVGNGLSLLLVAIVAALVYGLIGWVFTAVLCLLYNLVAGWVGGIEVEVDRVEPPAAPPAWMTSTTPQPPPTASPPSDPVS
jgi:hypothetical protein